MQNKVCDILQEIQKVILGKKEVVEKVMMAILADGHILLDDVPGVGKTTLAVALGKALGLDYQRIQFTPDVLPSDIVGFSIYDKSTGNLGIIGDTTAAYDAGEAYGDFFRAASIKRVTITSVNGAAFDENATYAVIGDNFLMNGNDTYYTFGAVKEAGENYVEVSTFGGLKTRDVVALYIQEVMNGTVGSDYANAQGRITVK